MPQQVCDFIALRGDPSDKIPGARGIGKNCGVAAAVLSRPGIDDRRRALRGRGRSSAPTARSPPWTRRHRCLTSPISSRTGRARAPGRRELGVERLASRLREAGEGSSNRAGQSPGDGPLHPDRTPPSSGVGASPARLIDGAPARRSRADARLSRRSSVSTTRTTWRGSPCSGGVLARRPHDRPPTTWEAARLAAGCSIRAVEVGGFALVAPTRATMPSTTRDGLLHLRQRRVAPPRAAGARDRADRDRRLGRASRQRHPGYRERRRLVLFVRSTSGRFILARGGRDGDDDPQRPARRRVRR